MTSYVGPNIRRPWKWVTPGSILGTLALLASGLLLRGYVQRFDSYGNTYGSLAGVMLLSFWFWIAAVVLLVAFQVDRIIENKQESDREQARTSMSAAVPAAECCIAADVMISSPRTCSRFSRVIEAVMIFKDEDCGLVPVVEEGKPIGVVTDRDVALGSGHYKELVEQPIEKIMATTLVAVAPSTPLSEVAETFGRKEFVGSWSSTPAAFSWE